MSEFTKKWIIDEGVPIVKSYDGNITLRALHYQLVAIGMTNDVAHYKKVVNAMIQARWDGLLGFDAFLDHERETIGSTDYMVTDVESSSEAAKIQIKAWATSYSKNKWENQPFYPEVFIEKKALQGVFAEPCRKWDVALNPCKGYPSLTFLNAAKSRYDAAIRAGKLAIILYFGDYDCSGEDIPRSIGDTLKRMGTEVRIRRILLMEEQVVSWKLPPAPTKQSDTRSRAWGGIGQVELDAVEPRKIVRILEQSLLSIFDEKLFKKLREAEAEEKQEFKRILKRDFRSLLEK